MSNSQDQPTYQGAEQSVAPSSAGTHLQHDEAQMLNVAEAPMLTTTEQYAQIVAHQQEAVGQQTASGQQAVDQQTQVAADQQAQVVTAHQQAQVADQQQTQTVAPREQAATVTAAHQAQFPQAQAAAAMQQQEAPAAAVTATKQQVQAQKVVPAAQTAAAVAATASLSIPSNGENQWLKNGYGQPCPPPPLNGKFSPEETAIVRTAVKEYCTAKKITTAHLCSDCDHKAELKGAWMEIAKRLPHRTVQSVYRHGVRQLHPFKRGPWTKKECNMLVDLVQKMGKKWSAIQAKLNRSADSCRDKYRATSEEFIKGKWKEGETEILKRLVREHLKVDPNADVKELAKMVEREGIVIPWSTISRRIGKRSRLSCFKKWQKMTSTGTGAGNDGEGSKEGTSSEAPMSTGAAAVDPNATDPASMQAFQQQAQAALQQQGIAIKQEPDVNSSISTSVATTPGNIIPQQHNSSAGGMSIPPMTETVASPPILNHGIVDTLSFEINQNPDHRLLPKQEGLQQQQQQQQQQLISIKGGQQMQQMKEEDIEQYDLFLLQQIADSNAAMHTEVDWSSMSHPKGGWQRWSEIIYFHQKGGLESQDLDKTKPICEVARVLLERKRKKGAAESVVEAVALPPAGALPLKQEGGLKLEADHVQMSVT